METVFDYNITDEERENIGIPDKENYLPFIGENSANLGLAELMHERGDMKRAAMYAEKLPPNLKWDFYRLITHP